MIKALKQSLSFIIFSSNVAFCGLDNITDTIETTKSGIIVIKAAHTTIRPLVFPTEKERCCAEEINQQIAVLKSEEALEGCLIEHAKDAPGEYNLPCKCAEPLGRFLSVAGFEKLPAIQEEFESGVSQLPDIQQTVQEKESSTEMSMRRKVAIGVAIGTGIVVVVVVGPVILPTAIAIAAEVGKSIEDALSKTAQLSAADKVKTTARIINYVQAADQLRSTPEDELRRLYAEKAQRGPLSERIRMAHSKIH